MTIARLAPLRGPERLRLPLFLFEESFQFGDGIEIPRKSDTPGFLKLFRESLKLHKLIKTLFYGQLEVLAQQGTINVLLIGFDDGINRQVGLACNVANDFASPCLAHKGS